MNKDIFLDSIQPGTKIDHDFCMKIYGYDISYPGFAELAITKIESLGLVGIREYYDMAVNNYEDKRRENMKEVVEWYKKKCQEDWERQVSKNKTRREHRIRGLPQDF